jgi:hypothetical protein
VGKVNDLSAEIDKILSPEALRRNWQLPKKGGSPESDINEMAPEPLQIVGRLLELVGQRYGEDDALVLNQLLAQSQQLLKRKYSSAGKTVSPLNDSAEFDTAQDEALDAELDEIITQIEDLAEAFEIDGRGR